MDEKADRNRIYRIWSGMKRRCFNPREAESKWYKSRGITVCNEWLVFDNFYSWALANGYKNNLSIDRINNDGNYEPSNCRWATSKEQSINKSNSRRIEYNGQNLTISQWAEITGLSREVITDRIEYGWDAEAILTTPLQSFVIAEWIKDYIPQNLTQEYFKKYMVLQGSKYKALTDISKASGVPYQALKDWKSGKKMPIYMNLKKLLLLIDVDVKDFLGDIDFVYENKVYQKSYFALLYADYFKVFTMRDMNKYFNEKDPTHYLQIFKKYGYLLDKVKEKDNHKIYTLKSEII